MKKTLLIFALLTTFTAAPAGAQKRVSLYQLPHHDIEEEFVTPRSFASTIDISADGIASPTRIVMKSELQPTTVSRLATYKIEEYNLKTDELKDRVLTTYSYDNYGFREKELMEMLDGSNKYATYQYTWREPGKIWDSKEYRSQYSGEYTLETRTFHDNNSVKEALTIDKISGDTVSYYVYDSDGYLVDGVRNTYGYKEMYIAPRKTWTRVNSNIVMFVDENNCLITKTYLDSQRKNLVGVMYQWYYVKGDYTNYICDYSESYKNGEITRVKGGKPEYTDDKIIVNSGEGSSYEDFKVYNVYEYSLNWFSQRSYSPGVSYWKKYYHRLPESDKLELYSEITETWIAPNLLKTENMTEGITYMPQYTLYDGADPALTYAYYDVATGAYCVLSSEASVEAKIGLPGSSAATVYTYFDKEGNETERLKIDNLNRWSRWNGTEWAFCTGILTLNRWPVVDEIGFDGENRMSYSKTSDGYRTEYTYINGGYCALKYKDAGNGETLCSKIYSTFTDNVNTYESTEYGENGVLNAYKSVNDYNAHITTTYNMSEGEWVVTGISSLDHVEIVDEKHYMRIYYNINAGGTAENRNKQIYQLPDIPWYYYWETYYWNNQNGTWIGSSKDTWQTDPTEMSLRYTQPFRPTLYYDDYMTPQVDNGWIKTGGHKQESKRWTWNFDTNAWGEPTLTTDTYELTATDTGKQIKHEKISVSGDKKDESVDIITVDAEGRVTMKYIKGLYVNSEFLYEYDTEGNYISYTYNSYEYNRGEIETYTYCELEILSGVEDVASEVANGATVDGCTVAAPEGCCAEVYNLQGVRVATIAAGNSTTLPAGLYIIATPSSTTKALLR